MLKALDSGKGTLVANKRTICEAHRKMYDVIVLELLESNPDLAERLIDLLEEAFSLGTKMGKKIRECGYNIWENSEDNDKEIATELRSKRVKLLLKLGRIEEEIELSLFFDD
jgi:hypothetical protein